MDFDLLYPGKFLKSGEFNGKDTTLTISGVKIEELGEGKDKETKGLIAFSDSPRKLVLNKTNGLCLKAMFGRETNDWIGKRVTFFAATITDAFTGEPTLAIRVRGSPDLAEAVREFQAKIGRKQVAIKLVRTGKQSGPSAPGALVNPAWTAIQKFWDRKTMTWEAFGKMVAEVTGKQGAGPLDANDVELVRSALMGPPPDSAPDAASEVAQ